MRKIKDKKRLENGDEEIQEWAAKGFPLSFVEKPAASSKPENNKHPNDDRSDSIKKEEIAVASSSDLKIFKKSMWI